MTLQKDPNGGGSNEHKFTLDHRGSGGQDYDEGSPKLESYIAAELLCLNGDWQKQSASLKGSHFARAKFFVARFYQLLAMPKSAVTTLALRSARNHIFDEAIRIGHGD